MTRIADGADRVKCPDDPTGQKYGIGGQKVWQARHDGQVKDLSSVPEHSHFKGLQRVKCAWNGLPVPVVREETKEEPSS
jgi:hypothetical protein